MSLPTVESCGIRLEERAVLSSPDLREFLAPLASERFKQVHWEADYLAFQDPGGLVSRAIMDELDLERRLAQPNFYKANSVFTRAACSNERRQARNVRQVVEDFRRGKTIQVRDIDRAGIQTAQLIAALLFTITGHPVEFVTLFVAPANAAALPPHRDTYDVLTVQLAGRKVWALEGPLPASADHRSRLRLNEDVVAEDFRPGGSSVTLQPGSCLFVPGGQAHSVVSRAETSVSIAFAIKRITICDLLERLVSEFSSADVLKQALPYRFQDMERSSFDTQVLDAIDVVKEASKLKDLRRLAVKRQLREARESEARLSAVTAMLSDAVLAKPYNCQSRGRAPVTHAPIALRSGGSDCLIGRDQAVSR